MEVESNPGNTNTEGAIESVHIKRLNLEKMYLRALFPQGQSNWSVNPTIT